MSIIVFQHSDHGTHGRLGATLRDHGFRLDVRRADLTPTGPRGGGGVPPDLDNVHGLIVMGGPQNVTDIATLPWMQAEVAFIKAAHAANLPVLGICLGHQLIAHALGGQVGPMDRPEVGLLPVSLGVAGQTEPLLGGIQWTGPQLQSHGQEVKALPPDALHLASSKACKFQAFKAGVRTFGFQYHFECDVPMAEALIAASRPELERAGLTAGEVRVQLDQSYQTYARMAERLCVNIANFCFPASERLTA